MGKQVTLRLDDSQAESLERLMHGGRSANDVLRTALTHYETLCCDAAALRAVGAPGGLIQVEARVSAEGFTFTPLKPLVGRKETHP